MSLSICDRIQRVIDSEGVIPVKDAAGVITPEGIDYAVRMKAYKECLAIARSVEEKDG
jgi:hypothetical protein